MAQAAKLDLYKKHRSEYVTPKSPVFVRIGPARYLAIAGTGAPGGEQFQASISALYAVAFTLKMTEKFAGHDYKVCHLEGQWWADGGCDFRKLDPKEVRWKLLIRIPTFLTQKKVDAAVQSVIQKGKAPLANQIRMETLAEGRCVQVLHTGPYAEESPTLEKMYAFAQGAGVEVRGPHHEIYLSDPRKVAPEKVRTILRYPVK